MALGCEVRLPHIDGQELKIKIPAGARAGQTLEIAARGLQGAMSRGRGNVIILLKMFSPSRLSKQMKKELETLREPLGLDAAATLEAVRVEAEERRRNF